MLVIGPLDSHDDLSKGHFGGMVSPKATTSEERGEVNLSAWKIGAIHAGRRCETAKVTHHFLVGERRAKTKLPNPISLPQTADISINFITISKIFLLLF